jgi:hypothetical protein
MVKWSFLSVALVLAASILIPTAASAQLNGENVKGDYGLSAGSVPPPGFYAAIYYINYDVDTVKNRNGDAIRIGEGDNSLTVQVIQPLFWWVSEKKLLGGNYSLMVSPSWANSGLEAPARGLDVDTGWSMSDLYVQPINLGWWTPQADFTAGVAFVAPTGKYDPEAQDNTGLGMWSFELFGGTTVYLDEARTWNLATTAFWETHSEKEDSNDKVGDLLTLEGGFGKSFVQGAVNIGVAYYAQWKLTEDEIDLALPAIDVLTFNEHQVFGVGPDITFPIAAGQKLIALVNVRYEVEFGAESTTEGNSLILSAFFPLGGMGSTE